MGVIIETALPYSTRLIGYRASTQKKPTNKQNDPAPFDIFTPPGPPEQRHERTCFAGKLKIQFTRLPNHSLTAV